MPRCELILYATPVGPLADACAAYFVAASTAGATVAQSYPPHCTLTGFFRWSVDHRRIAVEIVADSIAASGQPGGDDVTVRGFGDHDEWVGLELDSPWLERWTLGVAQRLDGVEDESIRCKDWLHLSLAYGTEDLGRYRELALEMVEPDAEVRWELGLWERRVERWTRLV